GVIDAEEAAVTVGLDQGPAVGRVRLPRLAQVRRHEHGPEAAALVAHVEHDGAVAERGRLALAAAAVGRRAPRPGRAVVPAGHPRRDLLALLVAALRGHHERPVREADPLLRGRREQPPAGPLQLAREVLGLAPGAAVVLRA